MDDLTRTSTNLKPNHTSQQVSPSTRIERERSPNRQKPMDFRLQVAEADYTVKTESLENIDSLRQKLSGSSRPEFTLLKVPTVFSNFTKQIITKAKGQQVIEVLQVANICQTNLSVFHWGGIDTPRTGDAICSCKIVVAGWIIGKTSQPQSAQFLVNQTIVSEISISTARPDVVKAHFTQHPNCGFRATIDLQKLPSKGQISVLAVFLDRHTAEIGRIKYCRYG